VESGYSLDDSGATWLQQVQAYKPSLETIGGGFSSSDSGYKQSHDEHEKTMCV